MNLTTSTPKALPARRYQWSRRHDGAVSAHARELDALVDGIASGAIPGPAYSLEALVTFAKSAVEGQRGEEGFARGGSWAVTPNNQHMPGDARHDFIMRTTWQVLTVLTWLRQHRPEAAAGVAGLDQAIQRGLGYGLLNRLTGHGYGSDDATLEALRLFGRSGLIALVEQEPGYCPELREILRELKRTFAEDLGRVGDDAAFGARTRATCREALEWLAGVQDA